MPSPAWREEKTRHHALLLAQRAVRMREDCKASWPMATTPKLRCRLCPFPVARSRGRFPSLATRNRRQRPRKARGEEEDDERTHRGGGAEHAPARPERKAQ